ncbi:TetR family transcriptional regulator [Thermoleophilia bacterium SCSIO 60948]|nr:TetR family transcriptional regulator [Thermoleophilia bacterium SCSIO 60948]
MRVTRSLFDERGLQDAPVEEIARSAGIARGLVYRYFSSKEELYVATMLDYLAELDEAMASEVGDTTDPFERLEACCRSFAAYCYRYPAFLDSVVTLMKRPAAELNESISPAVWINLGQRMSACLEHLAGALRDGHEKGVLRAEDPNGLANLFWAQAIGIMHLARIGVGVSQTPEGNPALFEIEPEAIVKACIDSTMAVARANVTLR